MGPYYYVVERISGDYGFLKRTDIEDNDLLQVEWENLVYTVIDWF